MRIIFLAVALCVFVSACGTMTWVNGISMSPDDKNLVAVGAQYKKQPFGAPSIDKPIRWFCVRGADDKLTCTKDISKLPQMK